MSESFDKKCGKSFIQSMFGNIGGKIKTYAVIECCIGIICSIVVGVIIMSYGMEISRYSGDATLIWMGFFVMLFGVLGSWISTLFLYGFGELVGNSKKILEKLEGPSESIQEQTPVLQINYQNSSTDKGATALEPDAVKGDLSGSGDDTEKQ